MYIKGNIMEVSSRDDILLQVLSIMVSALCDGMIDLSDAACPLLASPIIIVYDVGMYVRRDWFVYTLHTARDV